MSIASVWADPKKAAACRKAQSEGAKKRWSDPAKRAKAFKMVHTKALEKQRTITRRTNIAASFGLTLKQWMKMSPKEQSSYSYTHERTNLPNRFGGKHLALWHERLGRPVAELVMLSGIELAALKAVWKAKQVRR